MKHIPVMEKEVLELLGGLSRPLARFLDGTFGRGGHARAVMTAFPECKIVGLDRDAQAIKEGQANFAAEIAEGRLTLHHVNFTEAAKLDLGLFDGILLDLGVSSPQLDEAERGFSFHQEGPLDMRMDHRESLTASEIVNEWDEDDLFAIFRDLGECRRPGRVVAAILHDRKTKRYETTRDLAGMIERVEGWTRKGFHPATKYFMALRLKVNHELEDVETGVRRMMDLLESQGRLLVITFHSLEDRICKHLFKGNPELGEPVKKKVIKPEWNEQKSNPRSRSAKLRAFERKKS